MAKNLFRCLTLSAIIGSLMACKQPYSPQENLVNTKINLNIISSSLVNDSISGIPGQSSSIELKAYDPDGVIAVYVDGTKLSDIDPSESTFDGTYSFVFPDNGVEKVVTLKALGNNPYDGSDDSISKSITLKGSSIPTNTKVTLDVISSTLVNDIVSGVPRQSSRLQIKAYDPEGIQSVSIDGVILSDTDSSDGTFDGTYDFIFPDNGIERTISLKAIGKNPYDSTDDSVSRNIIIKGVSPVGDLSLLLDKYLLYANGTVGQKINVSARLEGVSRDYLQSLVSNVSYLGSPISSKIIQNTDDYSISFDIEDRSLRIEDLVINISAKYTTGETKKYSGTYRVDQVPEGFDSALTAQEYSAKSFVKKLGYSMDINDPFWYSYFTDTLFRNVSVRTQLCNAIDKLGLDGFICGYDGSSAGKGYIFLYNTKDPSVLAQITTSSSDIDIILQNDL